MAANKNERISALKQLGQWLSEKSDEMMATIHLACAENGWFTPENYEKMCNYWSAQLSEENLNAFLDSYLFEKSTKKLGIIMAGNIPMVGFHDLLCVWLSNHQAIVKPSSDDKVFMELVVKKLESLASIPHKIVIQERIASKDIDAIIATGSNNTYRYFETYFGKQPHIIRKNRNSIAILNGDETTDDWKKLGEDVLAFYGLGCRNVSLIFLPKKTDITKILDQWDDLQKTMNHHKYANNYTYQKAMLLMNQQPHLDTDYILLRELKEIHAPLGTVNYWYYENMEEVASFVKNHKEAIQCIANHAEIHFGNTQNPTLMDYADGVDTMRFLAEL
jgi:hypothetical protein